MSREFVIVRGRSSRGKDLTKKKEKDLNRANRLLREKKKE